MISTGKVMPSGKCHLVPAVARWLPLEYELLIFFSGHEWQEVQERRQWRQAERHPGWY